MDFSKKLKGLKERVLPQAGKVKGFAKLRAGQGSMLARLKKYINAD